MPVGEAAWFGKLCITSETSSIPEVCGDLMEYVNPHDQSAIVAALRRAIVDVEYRRDHEQRIRSATLRTWRDVAEDMYQILTGEKVSATQQSTNSPQ